METTIPDFSQANVTNRLPNYFDPASGVEIPGDLVGATLVGFGAIAEPRAVLGGGLVIDYRPKGGTQVIRLVLEATELSMQVVYQGMSSEKTTPASSRELSVKEPT